MKNLTCMGDWTIMRGMKKALIGFVVVSILALAGCGVKSDLARPDASFPRDYPVY
ncbi:MAG: lipoprotein [Alphaproteobacteria bacterium]